jgi:hypothetical protein
MRAPLFGALHALTVGGRAGVPLILLAAPRRRTLRMRGLRGHEQTHYCSLRGVHASIGQCCLLDRLRHRCVDRPAGGLLSAWCDAPNARLFCHAAVRSGKRRRENEAATTGQSFRRPTALEKILCRVRSNCLQLGVPLLPQCLRTPSSKYNQKYECR